MYSLIYFIYVIGGWVCWCSLALLFCWCCVEYRHAILVKIASVREVVLGAPLRVILKKLGSRAVAPNKDRLIAIVHRPNESFFLVPKVKISP